MRKGMSMYNHCLSSFFPPFQMEKAFADKEHRGTSSVLLGKLHSMLNFFMIYVYIIYIHFRSSSRGRRNKEGKTLR